MRVDVVFLCFHPFTESCVVECKRMRQSCYKITFARLAAPHDEIFIEIRDGTRRGAEICDATSW